VAQGIIHPLRWLSVAAIVLLLTIAAGLTGAYPAYALSEIKPSDAGQPEETPIDVQDNKLPPLEGPQVGPDGGLPQPDPVIRRSDDEIAPTEQVEPTEVQKDPSAKPVVEVLTDLARLPAPAARMRELIIQAAKSGEPEKLRMLLGTGASATRLSFGGTDEDPIEYLKSISGDGEGREILAIILDLFDSGFVHLDEATPDEIYVWPHFVTSDLDKLTPVQEVELLRILTAGDLDDMRSFGGYNFFRIGISPDGQWRFFLAGD